MDVRNCKSCGRLYNHFGGQPFCPECMNKLEETFKSVKEYIYEHPQAGVQEISTEFDISISIIHRWIREERLTFSDESPIGIPCESCGVTIKTGRFCKRCKDSLANGFRDAYKTEPAKKPQKELSNTNPRMRFFK